MPQLSVIVPVYNTQKYLDACVESILAQTLRDIELILVDDGSTDPSGAMCDAWAARDTRVRVIHQQNGGLAAARNTGMQAAQGEHIAFVDSDDIIQPTMYAELTQALQEHGAEIAVCTFRRFFNDDPARYTDDQLCPAVLRGKEEVRGALVYPLLGAAPGSAAITASSCRVLYPRALLQANGLKFISEREILSEDLMFNLEVFARCEAAVLLDRPLYLYRCNPDSLTTRHNPGRYAALRRMAAYMGDVCRALGLDMAECEPRIAYRFLEYASVCVKQQAQYAGFLGMSELVGQMRRDEVFLRSLAACPPAAMSFVLRLFTRLTRAGRCRILYALICVYLHMKPK